MNQIHPSQEAVYEALETVMDPEIPVISVVDLGIIADVKVTDKGTLVEMIPTFAGCPAIDQMREDITIALTKIGAQNIEVKVLYNRSWSSNMVSNKGKQLLLEFGLSPPPAFDGMLTLDVLQNAICPKCRSNNTVLKSPFGPTACRAIHHCNNCKETFEQFKPV